MSGDPEGRRFTGDGGGAIRNMVGAGAGTKGK